MNPVDPLWQEMKATGRLGTLPVTMLDETTSTNTLALEAARRGAETNSIILAETQSMGRGRLGRKWLSPPGTGLYFSMILRPELDPADLAKITLAAGLAVCRGVSTVTGLKPVIKWPNDLLIGGKKFAGILTETEAMAGENKPVVILGIGMNINTKPTQFPNDLQEKATSLSIFSGREICRGSLLKEVAEEIIQVVSRLEKEGFSGILAEWNLHDGTRNRELVWVSRNGTTVRGVSLGPDQDGLLRVRDQQGTVYEILSGDIELASPGGLPE
ncbi:MAG: biotin--[acetyl-CoA-carboxylase] ligase [Proteobacteria bacterium]|nr:biotin--[acetyl-CoA-carboxylase] ligase [Pseudomonadota bacterium]